MEGVRPENRLIADGDVKGWLKRATARTPHFADSRCANPPQQIQTLMPRLSRAVAFSIASLAAGGAAVADPPAPAKPKQAVLISFDSARDILQWKRSRALAQRTGAHFTYFVSCVFLLSPETRKQYTAPGKTPGKSNIGFAASKQEIADRLEQINLAATEGHDIGSHACGHFDGKDWNKADWLSEFGSFKRILENAYSINAITSEPAGWREIARKAVGFRAPICRQTRRSTRRCQRRAIGSTRAVCRAALPGHRPATASRASHCRRFRKVLTQGG